MMDLVMSAITKCHKTPVVGKLQTQKEMYKSAVCCEELITILCPAFSKTGTG
jgi:hypothetical protein